MQLEMINPDKIKPDKNQPRIEKDKEFIENLAKTYKEHGVIVPIEIDENNEIISGELRWLAGKIAKQEMPCIRKKGLTEITRLERQLIENVARKNLGTEEKGRAYKRWLNMYNEQYKSFSGEQLSCDSGINELARKIGVSKSSISEALEFIKEPEPVKKAVKRGDIGVRTVSTIRRAKIPQQRKERILEDAIKEKKGQVKVQEEVKFEEEMVKQNVPAMPPIKPKKNLSVEISKNCRMLIKYLDVRVIQLLPERQKQLIQISLDELIPRMTKFRDELKMSML